MIKSAELNRLIRHTAINEDLREAIESELTKMDHELLTDIKDPGRTDVERVVTAGGKRLRPILAFLCYRMGGEKLHEVVPLMCMLELMHTASIIHDDVVDDAKYRRGCATINSVSGNWEAVQCGDFLLAKAMGHLRLYRGTNINKELAYVSAQMCLGELQQLKTRYNLADQTREKYFIQIYRKTASLIAASCYVGAIAGGLSELHANKLREFGENLGIAFQLCDDLLDFSADLIFGKRLGQDLKSGIYTLPVIYLYEEGVPASVQKLFEKRNKNIRDIRQLIGFVEKSQAIEYTKRVIRMKSAEAVEALSSFSESAEKSALIKLSQAMVNRLV